MNHSRRRGSMASSGTVPRRQCRFPRSLFSRLSHSPTPSARGTFLKRINRFDNTELGIGNKDGRSLVMATRKLVELSFLAMQDAGIEYRGKKIGSFMCGTSTEHWTPVSALCPQPSRHLAIPYVFSFRKRQESAPLRHPQILWPIASHMSWVSVVLRFTWTRRVAPP